MNLFISIFIKFFVLLTPFFVLTMFLALTKGMDRPARRAVAVRVTLAVIVACLVLFFFGNALFALLGITVDSFRIGAGALLFLSAVALVRGSPGAVPSEDGGDVSVVPLAIPITVGPASTGALLVLGAGLDASQKLVGCAALVSAILCVGAILFMSHHVQRLLGKMGIEILTKLTGLILAALAAQIVFTGIVNFMGA
ncbi:MAG: MarC family protein [Proteobacteria bacterium]|nr:MarC family protein [Pseudomonadota bacterium]